MNTAEQIVESILSGDYAKAMSTTKSEIKQRVGSLKENLGKDILEKCGMIKIKESDPDEDESDEDESKKGDEE